MEKKTKKKFDIFVKTISVTQVILISSKEEHYSGGRVGIKYISEEDEENTGATESQFNIRIVDHKEIRNKRC